MFPLGPLRASHAGTGLGEGQPATTYACIGLPTNKLERNSQGRRTVVSEVGCPVDHAAVRKIR